MSMDEIANIECKTHMRPSEKLRIQKQPSDESNPKIVINRVSGMSRPLPSHKQNKSYSKDKNYDYKIFSKK